MKNNKILKCPNCEEIIQIEDKKNYFFNCNKCNLNFSKKNNFYNFLTNSKNDFFYKKAKNTWGKNLHNFKLKKNKEFIHSNIFIELYKKYKTQLFEGKVLEIGVGRGNDLKNIINKFDIVEYNGVDLGQNLQQLSEMYTNDKIVSLIRSDCLYLPFFKNTFDTVYSYGVFHHTISPQKAIDESLRVLKKNGILLFYVYSDHEYNFIKNKLIFIEKFVLNIFYVLPNIICKFLIFLFIMPFTYIFIIMPTLILRLIKKDKLADYFPLSFTTSASEIYHNLQDRLMAPINKRFSRKELFGILNKYNLQQVKIKTLDSGERSGHYVFIKK